MNEQTTFLKTTKISIFYLFNIQLLAMLMGRYVLSILKYSNIWNNVLNSFLLQCEWFKSRNQTFGIFTPSSQSRYADFNSSFKRVVQLNMVIQLLAFKTLNYHWFCINPVNKEVERINNLIIYQFTWQVNRIHNWLNCKWESSLSSWILEYFESKLDSSTRYYT